MTLLEPSEDILIGLGRDSPIVYWDADRQEYVFVLDPRSAEAAVYAMRAMAAELEGHAREVRRVADDLPCQSYGARNRLRIAEQHERMAWRLRVIDGYQWRLADDHHFHRRRGGQACRRQVRLPA